MKTPKEFTNNLKQGIITDEMLGAAIFSANKRAKNWRDNAQTYYSEGCRHRAFYYHDRYSFQNATHARMMKEEYYDLKERLLSIVEPKCIHKAVKMGEEWYFYYEVGNYTFHSPVGKEQALASGLTVVMIENLNTKGKEITELVSVDFIKKVVALIESGDYTLEQENE